MGSGLGLSTRIQPRQGFGSGLGRCRRWCRACESGLGSGLGLFGVISLGLGSALRVRVRVRVRVTVCLRVEDRCLR